MKPKTKKNAENDSIKTLTTSMKPTKRRSIENQVKKSPVSVQMLNILEVQTDKNLVGRETSGDVVECHAQRGRITRQKARVKLIEASTSQVIFYNPCNHAHRYCFRTTAPPPSCPPGTSPRCQAWPAPPQVSRSGKRIRGD